MANTALDLLTPDTQEAVSILLQRASQYGFTAVVTSTLRTCSEQDALYAQGRTTPGPVVTNARGCVSWHVLGRAVDLRLQGGKAADYKTLGLFWESMGGHWGGRIAGLDDLGHFEWHPGYRIEQMCSNPSDCKGAVARSRALYLPPPRPVTSEPPAKPVSRRRHRFSFPFGAVVVPAVLFLALRRSH